MKVDTEQNARLYGANTPVQDILQIKKTKRPPAFDRLVRVRNFFHLYNVVHLLPFPPDVIAAGDVSAGTLPCENGRGDRERGTCLKRARHKHV